MQRSVDTDHLASAIILEVNWTDFFKIYHIKVMTKRWTVFCPAFRSMYNILYTWHVGIGYPTWRECGVSRVPR